MLGENEVREIIKIGEKAGWIKNRKGRKYIVSGKVKDFRITTKWGSDSFSVKSGKYHIVFSSDQHIEGTHFEKSYMHLDEIGERALRCALSDIASTGAEPVLAFVNVGANSTKTAEKIGEGIIRCAKDFRVKLCGGDISRADRINISSFVVGITEKEPFSRFGAKPGDHIFITGTIGDSALAFFTIKKKGRKFAEKNIPNALEKFLKPPVRKIPQKINHLVRFTSDLSDGPLVACKWISILNSVSVEFFPERIPFSEEFIKFSTEILDDPQSIAITWGEDYELLFGIGEKNLKTENDFEKMEKFGEVIGIILSERDSKNAINKKYPYIKVKGLNRENFIFFTPFVKINLKRGFRHFGY